MSAYQQVRSSATYIADWEAFLQESIQVEMSRNFYQYVGHYIFKELVKIYHPLEPSSDAAPEPLTDAETNALKYAAGYVPRMLKCKMQSQLTLLRMTFNFVCWTYLMMVMKKAENVPIG